MNERLAALEAAIVDNKPTPEQARQMEVLDSQFIEMQRYAERQCRKILKPDMQFSLEVKLWNDRMNAWRELIRLKRGQVKHKGHCLRTARRRGLPHPESLTLEACEEGFAYARGRKRDLRSSAPARRQTHLQDLLMDAEAKGDAERATKVRGVIKREGDKKMWYCINRSQKDPRGGATIIVQKQSEDGLVESATKDETEGLLFEEIEYRFELAKEAPINSTMLLEQLGCLADSEIAQQIVEGMYGIPEEVDDKTALLLEEIGRVGVQLRSGDVVITVTPEDFQYYWKHVREGTSSSATKVHFGHYIAAATSDEMSNFLARKITLVAKCGIPPERWSYGLTVMLEKVAGVALVNKLRAILLMEADFNMHNKLIFGSRMLDQARKNGIIPEEHFVEKQSTAEDGKFVNVLLADVSRQRRTRMSSISADASNCYDRIHHAIMALVFLSLGVGLGPIRNMLYSIQLMKFFLRTGWGESTRYIGGDVLKILHGLCQGNGAAPAAWLVLSAIIIRLYKRRGLGISIRSPLSNTLLELMGVVYVDDTDLLLMEPDCHVHGDLWRQSREACETWGGLLIATGGMLKPEKCHYYMWDHRWNGQEWESCDVRHIGGLCVPLADGASAPIDQLPCTRSKKTLGLHTNPAGNCRKHLDVLQDKIQVWTERLSNGRLPSRWGWVSYHLQLWPSLRFGLGTNSSPAEDLQGIEDSQGQTRPLLPPTEPPDKKAPKVKYTLRAIYRKMLPYLGVNRNIRYGWRHLHSSFCGIGLRTFFQEVVISRIDLFLQHFRSNSAVGRALSVSLEHMQIEAGTRVCPLSTSYQPFGPFTTPCWGRSFWQSLDRVGLPLHLDGPEIAEGRDGDQLLIDFYQANSEGRDVSFAGSFHRCRLAWHAMQLSDLTDAEGRRIEPHFARPPDELHQPSSPLSYQKEEPSLEDWQNWAAFWSSATGPNLTLSRPLGRWKSQSTRVWRWFWLDDGARLALWDGETTHWYQPDRVQGRTRSSHRYALLRSELSVLGHTPLLDDGGTLGAGGAPARVVHATTNLQRTPRAHGRWQLDVGARQQRWAGASLGEGGNRSRQRGLGD